MAFVGDDHDPQGIAEEGGGDLVEDGTGKALLAEGEQGQGQGHIPGVHEHDRQIEAPAFLMGKTEEDPGGQATAQGDPQHREGDRDEIGHHDLALKEGGEDQTRGGDEEDDLAHLPQIDPLEPGEKPAQGDN